MRLVFVTGLAALAAACGTVSAQPETARSDESAPANASSDFALSDFDAVGLAGPDSVDIAIGPEFAIRATGSPAILDALELEVEDGALRIGRRDDLDYRDRRYRGRARIAVTMPVLRRAALSGSGDFQAEAGEAENFEAAIAGSGDMSIGTVTATTAELAITGSGDLSAAGTVRDIEAAISGSGSMLISDLRAQTMEVAIQGSGEIGAYVTETVDASFTGSGQVRARGGARCRSTAIGSGRLTCTD